MLLSLEDDLKAMGNPAALHSEKILPLSEDSQPPWGSDEGRQPVRQREEDHWSRRARVIRSAQPLVAHYCYNLADEERYCSPQSFRL